MKKRNILIISIVCIMAVVGFLIVGMTVHNGSSKIDRQESKEKESKKKVEKKHSKKVISPKGIKVNVESSKSSSVSKKNVESFALTESQKLEVVKYFLDWATESAKVGNMAVTDIYFQHGSGGIGDYYVSTPDGDIQVQDQKKPGADAFDIHAIGGLTFYTTLSGNTGYQDLSSNSIADGYGDDVDTKKPIVKYLLADNGIVYESANGTGTGNPGSGYYEKNDDGNSDVEVEYSFYESNDLAAQSKFKDILANYINK